MRSIRVMGFCGITFLSAAACENATSRGTNLTPSQPVAPQPQQQADPLEEFKKRTPSIIADYLRDHTIRKVQLGAGPSRLEGWLNTDIEPGPDALAYLDATQRFPFEDGSVHYIFSEHLIEHLTYEEGQGMIAEAYRVLAPGGRMRISTPDLMQFIALFDKNPSEDARAYIDGKRDWHQWPREPNAAAIILNLQLSSWGHRFMYDFATLSGALTRSGFHNPTEFEENVSNDPHLRELEERDTGVNARWSAYETMSIEVEKPRISTTH